jgi:hypothetical protein
MAKNQHWLPQLYLRSFRAPQTVSPVPRLWVFFREGPEEPRLTAIEEIAMKRYLYSPPTDAGSRDHSVDQRLEGLETMLGPVWPTVANGYLQLDTDPIRKALALFVATLYTRHPQRIDDFAATHAKLVAFLSRLPEDNDGNPALTQFEAKGKVHEFDASGWAEFTRAGKTEHQRSFAQALVPASGDLAKLLLKKRFAIVTSDHPVFATCDAPIVVRNASKEPFGFATKGTVVYLPLSPTRFLILDDEKLPNGYYETQPGFPEAMNYQTWCAADRYLLSASPSDEILAGLMAFADHHDLS